MNEMFQEKRKEYFILVGLILVLIGTIYFLFVHPKYAEIDSKRESNFTTETKISSLDQEIQNLKKEDEKVNLFELRKKIPEHDEVEKLLLHLEEIEGLTRSRIENIDFTYEDGESVLQRSEEVAPVIEEEAEADETDEDTDQETEDDTSAEIDASLESDKTDRSDIDSKLKTIEIQLEVNSPNYLSFIQFITELENLDRILFVSELDLTKPTEQQMHFDDVFDATISHNITLQTFTYKD